MFVNLHAHFAWFVIFANGSAGVLLLASHRYRQLRSFWLWVLTTVAQIAMFMQVCLGAWLMTQQDSQASDMHALYGFSALVAVGIAYSYRHQLQSNIHLLYGWTALFLMGLGVRLMFLD